MPLRSDRTDAKAHSARSRFQTRRARLSVLVGVMLLGCDDQQPTNPHGDDGRCHEEVVGYSWQVHAWGSVAINDIAVASDDTATLYVRGVREDGRGIGVNRPGRLAELTIGDRPLVGISASASGELTALSRDGATYESTLAESGVWNTAAPVSANTELRAISSGPSGERWAVGRDGLVARREASEWSLETHGSIAFEDIWAADDEVWIVGGETVLRGDENGYFREIESPGRGLRAVTGTRNGDIWVAGDAGLLCAWNGTEWASIATASTEALVAVWADPDHGVWAASDAGSIVHVPPGQTEAKLEELPEAAAGLVFTAIHGARVPRLRAVGAADDYVISVWGATRQGSVVSRGETTATICP